MSTQTDQPDNTTEETPEEVAATAANDDLEHSVTGRTTRSDRTDLGVPVTPGDAREPVGPEDALGVGQKRGDYRDRIVGAPHEGRAIDGGGQPVRRHVDRETGKAVKADAKNAVEVQVDVAPSGAIVDQRPRADDIGDTPALKGGVETDPDAPLGPGARSRLRDAGAS